MERRPDHAAEQPAIDRVSEERIRDALLEVRERGAAFVPALLDPAMIEALRTETAGAVFEEQTQRYLRAQQRVASYVVTPPFVDYPEVGAVAERL